MSINLKPSLWVPLICMLFLVGCASTSDGATASSTVSAAVQEEIAVAPSDTALPTQTAAATPTPSPTLTPTLLPSLSPTPTSTPEPSNTPTPTSTPTLSGFQPGIYGVGGCARVMVTSNAWVDWCVVSVEVLRNQNMVFNVSWTGFIPAKPKLTKSSDINNPNMFITDNLGNHYRFVGLSGAAAERFVLVPERTYNGTFVFSPALPGANTFTFHDNDNRVTIENMVLDKPAIAKYEFIFQKSKLALEYREDLWTSVQDENGLVGLSYLPLENCQIQELEASQPSGKLKNVIEIGEWTYEIYGRLEENWGIREYLIVAGPPGYDLQSKPIFQVRLPLENSLPCLNDLSGLLMTLRLTKED